MERVKRGTPEACVKQPAQPGTPKQRVKQATPKQRNPRNTDARDTALELLTVCRRQNAWADAAFNARLQRVPMSDADAALCGRLLYGVTQNRILLDFYLNAFCTQKVSHMQEPLADILRLGAYQILFLDRVPDRAAVDEAVKQAIRAGRKAASGMVNAVLRRLSREKASLPPVPDAATRYSHPRWLVERVRALLGAEETEQFLSENNRIPPLTIQVNPERASAEALLAELSESGVDAARHSWVPDCLELSGSGTVTRLASFRAGKFYVQDAAARLVTDIAGITRGASVLDVCAAPGGKTFGAALRVGENGSVLACDVNANKLPRIRDGAERLGLAARIRTGQADAREFHPDWEAKFDIVLVDAPCSGLGIIRKKPDIRYRDPEALSALPGLQYAILDNASRYVAPGGTLVYSTCTVLPEENEGVTDQFLSGHPDFRRVPFGDTPGQVTQSTPGQVTLWPQRDHTDGFYICRMGKA